MDGPQPLVAEIGNRSDPDLLVKCPSQIKLSGRRKMAAPVGDPGACNLAAFF
jgi:hypothetical protein